MGARTGRVIESAAVLAGESRGSGDTSGLRHVALLLGGESVIVDSVSVRLRTGSGGLMTDGTTVAIISSAS